MHLIISSSAFTQYAGQIGLCHTHLVHGVKFVSDGIAHDVKPLTATVNVKPALVVQSLWVLPVKQIIRPFGVTDFGARAFDVGFTTKAKLAFVARAAIGTRYS